MNREASNASRIDYPIADGCDLGETPDGIISLAMEYADGPPLTKLIATEGPLPPTRGGAAPAADGLPVASAAGMAIPTAPRRQAVPVPLGAGGVVGLGVAAMAMVMRRCSGRPGQSPGVTPAGQAPSDVSPGRDTARFGARIDSSSGTRAVPDPGAEARASAASVSAGLDSLEMVVSGDVTPAEAARVLRDLEQMRGRIKGNEQVVHAAIVKTFAEGSRKDNAAACAALRGVRPIASGTRRARDVENGLAGCD